MRSRPCRLFFSSCGGGGGGGRERRLVMWLFYQHADASSSNACMSGLRVHGPVLRTELLHLQFNETAASALQLLLRLLCSRMEHARLWPSCARVPDCSARFVSEVAESRPSASQQGRRSVVRRKGHKFARVSTTAEEQDVAADTDQLADKPSPVGTTTRWLAFLSVTCALISNYMYCCCRHYHGHQRHTSRQPSRR